MTNVGADDEDEREMVAYSTPFHRKRHAGLPRIARAVAHRAKYHTGRRPQIARNHRKKELPESHIRMTLPLYLDKFPIALHVALDVVLLKVHVPRSINRRPFGVECISEHGPLVYRLLKRDPAVSAYDAVLVSGIV